MLYMDWVEISGFLLRWIRGRSPGFAASGYTRVGVTDLSS